MTLRLKDTLSGAYNELPSHRLVTLYVCGITPYDVGHLGHAFTFVQFDTLVRALEWLGRRVEYVQNVTDIDDSILNKARQLGTDWLTLGNTELERHQRDMASLAVRPPTHLPRATEVIPEIHTMIAELLDRGCAYVAEGSVFFRVRSAIRYGELSRLDRDRMVEICAQQDDADLDDPRKEDPIDVALWKPWSGAKEEPSWHSPWGAGRPGWTIECAAINHRFLGPQVDLHGGGADLKFPHHETEIALMEAATGRRPFVKTWLHTGMVHHEGDKMSKSLGNLVTAGDLVERFGGDAVRLYLLSHHYRQEWEYSEDGLRAAAEAGDRLRARMRGQDGDGADVTDEFRAALEDDLDTPRALAALERASAESARRLAAVLGLSDGMPPG
jgi:L-cysteine:1D-myo-inositol 2-amino-2-deoxy-alpha-D-glucopyranoside ligase